MVLTQARGKLMEMVWGQRARWRPLESRETQLPVS